MTRTDGILIGFVVAVGVAIWAIASDTNPLDQIGDAIVTLTTTEETRLSQLEPTTQQAARDVIADCASQGIKIHVGQTLRTSAQEKAQIDAGHTSATLVNSWHEIGRALDGYVVDPDTGETLTSDAQFRDRPDRLAWALAFSRTAERHGFRQLGFNADDSPRYITGKKGPVWDVGHIEYRAPYGTLAEAVATEGPSYGIG